MFAHARGKRVAALATVIGAVGLVATGVAYSQLTQIAVLTGPSNQWYVTAEGNTLAWSRYGPTNHLFNAFVRIGSGPVARVNPAGTQAYVGGLTGDRLIYQQIRYGQSDLRFYNVVSHTYGVVPAGWNTSLTEYAPTISRHYVLFGRFNERTGEHWVFLGDLTTGHLKLLASLTGTLVDEVPGQVNGNYATWTSCINVNVECDVYEYNIATGNATRVSNTFATGKFQYASSVTSTGTIYLVHSASFTRPCGEHATINKRALGAARTVIVSLAHGLDVGVSFADNSNGTPNVYYSRLVCAAGQADLYKVVD